MSEQKLPFVKLAEFILQDPRIEPLSRLYYLQLLIESRSYGDEIPHSDYEETSRQLNIKASQVRRALKDLEEAGFISVRRHEGGFDVTLTAYEDVFGALIRLAAIK